MEEERRLEVMEKSTGNKEIEGRYHRFNKLLGKGAYKTVWKAFDTISQVDVAWNSIDLSAMTDNEKEKVFLECEMLQKLNHSNILKIRDKWSNKEREELCFVTDVIQNGSLRSYFKKRKINLKKLKEISRQILLALEYLHSNNVIHRDLKCDNIFIDSNNSNNSKVVLGDLGLSVNFNGQSRMSIVGTPHWMAPELYNEKYNELVDIWSFGMCVLELTTNTIPYKECKNTIAVYNKVMIEKQKPDVLFTISDQYIRSFIKICLDFNPQLRPTALELLSHPFLLSRYPRDYILCDNLIKGKYGYTNNIRTNNNVSIDNNNNLKPPKKGKSNKKRKTKHKTDVKVQNVVSKRNITTIKLQIYRKDDKPMAVTFDFNMNVDRASDVAHEMISELKLPQIYRMKVETAINKAIQSENNHKTQIVGHSLIMNKSSVDPDKSIKDTDNNKPIKDTINKPMINNINDDDIEIFNDLILEDLSSYLGGQVSVEIDEKQKEQIVKKRDELLKEYVDFIQTKQQLLKLKVETITSPSQREDEIAKVKRKIEKKKKEAMQQYENYINDHKAIAQYTLTNMAQNFIFEKDKKYQFFMKSQLTQNDKYMLENILKDKRQKIVDDYLSFYNNLIKKYVA